MLQSKQYSHVNTCMSNNRTVQEHLLQVQLSKFQACMPPILPPVPWQNYRSAVPLSPSEFCHRLIILLIHGSSLSQLIGVHTTSKMCFFCPNSRLNFFSHAALTTRFLRFSFFLSFTIYFYFYLLYEIFSNQEYFLETHTMN